MQGLWRSPGSNCAGSSCYCPCPRPPPPWCYLLRHWVRIWGMDAGCPLIFLVYNAQRGTARSFSAWSWQVRSPGAFKFQMQSPHHTTVLQDISVPFILTAPRLSMTSIWGQLLCLPFSGRSVWLQVPKIALETHFSIYWKAHPKWKWRGPGLGKKCVWPWP